MNVDLVIAEKIVDEGIHGISNNYIKDLIVNGRGYGSFLVAALRCLKSTQILNLSFFFGTTTIGDNHVA